MENGSNLDTRKKRKLHTFEKAKLAYRKIQDERSKKLEKFQRKQAERQEAVNKSKKAKKQKLKYLYKKNKNGQLKLGLYSQYLLEKIQKKLSEEGQTSNCHT